MYRTKVDYDRELKSGQEFEQHCLKVFASRGVSLDLYSTIEEQRHGETVQGVEFKYDKRFRETGNLFIEVEERSTSWSDWHEAGITKKDNSIAVAIGDMNTIWLFAMKDLRTMRASQKFKEVTNKTNTGKGFLLPVKMADILALNKIETQG